MNGVVNIEDLRRLAKKRLPKIAYELHRGRDRPTKSAWSPTNRPSARRVLGAALPGRHHDARAVDHAVRPDLFQPDLASRPPASPACSAAAPT